MSRLRILGVYVVLDFLIIAGVLWAAFAERWPARQFLIPAIVLFALNGLWLIVMTVRDTPPGGGGLGY
jgi:hypothetical protein